MKPEKLLNVLDPEPGDPLFAASLAKTLSAVRVRRRRGQVFRGVGILAVILVGFVCWQERRSIELAALRPPTVAVVDTRLELREVISSVALPAGMWVSTQPDPSAWIQTSRDASVERVNDDELLSLAPGCLALTRLNGRAGVVLLCEELWGLP